MTAHTVTAFAENSVHDRIYQCGVRTTIGPHHPRLAYPTAPAFYPVPVRPLRSLPPASSPPRLTATQLPLASDSGRHGSQRTSTSNISAMPGAPHQLGSLRAPDLARIALEAKGERHHGRDRLLAWAFGGGFAAGGAPGQLPG